MIIMSKIKKWLKETAGPWIKKSWLQIVNVFVVLGAYGALDTAEVMAAWWVGLWGFVLLGYWTYEDLCADKVIMPLLTVKWEKFSAWVAGIFNKK
jgi:hypothetical protein